MHLLFDLDRSVFKSNACQRKKWTQTKYQLRLGWTVPWRPATNSWSRSSQPRCPAGAAARLKLPGRRKVTWQAWV